MLPNRQGAPKCDASHADNVELIKCVLVADFVVLCPVSCVQSAARDATAALSKLGWQQHLLWHDSLILIEL